jgi:hypothetical protein
VGVAGKSSYVCNAPASPVLVDELLEHLAFAEATQDTPLADVVDELVAELRHSSRLVIVSTRAPYLEQLVARHDPSTSRRVQHFIRSALWLNVSDRRFDDYFQLD